MLRIFLLFARFGLLGGALGLALMAPLSAGPGTAAWTEASLLRFDSAHEAFARLAESPDNRTRLVRLGEAVTLLNAGSGNVAQATRRLEALVAETGDDEPGIGAAFMLARIAQWHEHPARPVAALAAYDALAARQPMHPLGQLALIKALVIRLYSPGSAEEKSARWQAADALAARLPDDALRSEYHQVMAIAGARFGLPPAWRLRHLTAAVTLGIRRFKARKDFLLATAETARTCGHRDVALRHYALFLALARQDERRSFVQLRYEEYRQKGEGS